MGRYSGVTEPQRFRSARVRASYASAAPEIVVFLSKRSLNSGARSISSPTGGPEPVACWVKNCRVLGRTSGTGASRACGAYEACLQDQSETAQASMDSGDGVCRKLEILAACPTLYRSMRVFYTGLPRHHVPDPISFP